MSRSHAAPKLYLAILSLVAVIVGALEHEDLVFQSQIEPSVSAVVHGSTEQDASVPSLTSRLDDSGTEGTFRSQGHQFWLSPVLNVTLMLGLCRVGLAKQLWWLRKGERREVRPFAAGGLVLRL